MMDVLESGSDHGSDILLVPPLSIIGSYLPITLFEDHGSYLKSLLKKPHLKSIRSPTCSEQSLGQLQGCSPLFSSPLQGNPTGLPAPRPALHCLLVWAGIQVGRITEVIIQSGAINEIGHKDEIIVRVLPATQPVVFLNP